MSKGIYQYVDVKTDEVVYIGKDSNIDKNSRYYTHKAPSHYNEQPFNRILQNNPDRYEYNILYSSDDTTKDILDTLERSFIKRYNPKFNFTRGGEGGSLPGVNSPRYGKKHTFETRKKMSENHYDNSKENNPLWKDYARINYGGKSRQGKQQYIIRFNGKYIKKSINVKNLIEWFNENYPNEELIIHESIEYQ